VILHLLVGNIGSNLFLHTENESENFLVSESVKRSSETSEGGGVGEERIGESGSNEI
jgi:hypothetical protein